MSVQKYKKTNGKRENSSLTPNSGMNIIVMKQSGRGSDPMDENVAKKQVEELEKLLVQQENDLVALRDERNRTIRRLKKVKLDATVPSDAVIKFAKKSRANGR